MGKGKWTDCFLDGVAHFTRGFVDKYRADVNPVSCCYPAGCALKLSNVEIFKAFFGYEFVLAVGAIGFSLATNQKWGQNFYPWRRNPLLL